MPGVIPQLQGALAARDAIWRRRRRQVGSIELFGALCARRDALEEWCFRDLHRQLYNKHVASRHGAGYVPVLAVDGSKLRLPRSLLRHGFHKQQPASDNPLALLNVVYDVRTGVVVDYDISASFDERGALFRLLRGGAVPRGSVLLADRGFYSCAVWRAVEQAGVRAIVRVRRNADRKVREFAASGRRAFTHLGSVPTDIVRWHADGDGREEPGVAAVSEASQRPIGRSRANRDAGCRAKFEESVARAPSESEWVLATTVDSATAADLVSAYGTRWSIEVAFKVLKSALGLRALACRSAVAVRHVIEALCLFSLVVALERDLRPPQALAPRQPRRRVPGCHPVRCLRRSGRARRRCCAVPQLTRTRCTSPDSSTRDGDDDGSSGAALVRELADAQGVLVEGVRSIAALAAGGADTADPTSQSPPRALLVLTPSPSPPAATDG